MKSMSGLEPLLQKARGLEEQMARLVEARWLKSVLVWSGLLVVVPLRTCCRA